MFTWRSSTRSSRLSFPLAYAVADDFNRPDGSIGGNWQTPVNGSANIVVIAGAQATRRTTGINLPGRAGWLTQLSPLSAVGITVSVLPLSGDQIVIGFIKGLGSSVSFITLTTTPSASQLVLAATGSGSSTAAGVAFNAGDSMALTVDATLTATSWYRPSGGLWTDRPTGLPSTLDVSPALAGQAPQGWFSFFEADDATVRLDNWFVETLPGDYDIPLLGYGAC